jgi:hypothetical protein
MLPEKLMRCSIDNSRTVSTFGTIQLFLIRASVDCAAAVFTAAVQIQDRI